MDKIVARQICITNLISLAKVKNYLSFDDILEATNNYKLSIDDIDRISAVLLLQGVIVKEKNVRYNVMEDEVLRTEDRSKLDYEKIFNEVIMLDPQLRPYILEIKRIIPPQYKEVNSLIFQAKDGNIYARDRIITMYLKIVIRMALWASKKYSLPIADAIGNGNIGLVIALQKYDPNCEYKFSVYAPHWIRQMMMRSAQSINHDIYIPVYAKEKLFNIYDIYLYHFCEECIETNICNELIESIAEKLECSVEEAKDYIEYFEPYQSIEEQLLLDNEAFSDNAVFEGNMNEMLLQKEAIIAIKNVFETITPREAEVLDLRFGLTNRKKQTLEVVGKAFGVTRERIRQIEAKALRKIRHPSRSKKLKYFLD